MSRSTLSPFDVALAQADKVISDVMMSVYVINGKEYKAVLDETPKEMEPMNGIYRTLTLFKSSGYKPGKGDKTTINGVDMLLLGLRLTVALSCSS